MDPKECDLIEITRWVSIQEMTGKYLKSSKTHGYRSNSQCVVCNMKNVGHPRFLRWENISFMYHSHLFICIHTATRRIILRCICTLYVYKIVYFALEKKIGIHISSLIHRIYKYIHVCNIFTSRALYSSTLRELYLYINLSKEIIYFLD